MFRRRDPLPFIQRLKRFIWPTMSFRRLAQLYWLRIRGVKDSNKHVAAGLATGIAMSSTPYLGLHLVITLMVCRATKLNKLAGIFGTLAGNPLTIPLFLVGSYYTGSYILGRPDSNASDIEHMTLGYFLTHLWECFLPMIVGNIPIFAGLWVGAYLLTKIVLDKCKPDASAMGFGRALVPRPIESGEPQA